MSAGAAVAIALAVAEATAEEAAEEEAAAVGLAEAIAPCLEGDSATGEAAAKALAEAAAVGPAVAVGGGSFDVAEATAAVGAPEGAGAVEASFVGAPDVPPGCPHAASARLAA